MILNLLYFLTNEQTNLIEHCEPVNELLDTPSGCHLVKVYLPKRWLSHLIKEPNESSSQNLDENSFEIVDKKNSNDDLVMDILPKSTRFRTKISLSSFTQFNTDYSNDLTNEFFDDGIDQEIALYIQKNSKLSLVLMCLDSMSDKYTKDFIQKIFVSLSNKSLQNTNVINFSGRLVILYKPIISTNNLKWQKIVNNFSDLELDLMEEQRNISDLVPRNSITDNNGLPYSCVIDRNQIIKNSFFGKSNSVPRSTMSNMNLYYELFKAIPELTKMDIKLNTFYGL
ncbi:hypothetical protein BpHYR1_031521 [Brachionus plicatilis]|uniref:Uncharacterized protein n=1 Tax=Brachionus plicatilis TaxID=10195 RepID=A0A3M7T1R9_BRAPC|nr:hypothetical protein BpHYR1_031521 [Brachionus plicatilis]